MQDNSTIAGERRCAPGQPLMVSTALRIGLFSAPWD